MMINPVGMALAAMTVMLWILWSDSLRSRRPTAILYAVRIALYLIVSGILVLNLVRHPAQFNASARVIVVLTVLVGVLGAGYFARKMARRQ